MSLSKQMVESAAAGALKDAKAAVEKVDFSSMYDRVINKFEGIFPEDSMPDRLAEMIGRAVRDLIDVPDSDPEN